MELALLLSLLVQAPPSEATIRITLPDGLAEKPGAQVFRVGDAREEAEMLHWLIKGLDAFDQVFTPTLHSDRPRAQGQSLSFAVPPGNYHVRVGGFASAAWFRADKVAAGETRDFKHDPRDVGSLKGSWSVDLRRRGGEGPSILRKTALVRDGKVWARADGDTLAFEMKGVPPGEYSLVITEFFDALVWIQDGVKITASKEAVVAATIKRADLGGLRFELTAGGKPYAEAGPNDFILVDSRNRYAGRATPWTDAGRSGILFEGYPLGADFTLLGSPKGFLPVQKPGIKLRPDLKKGTSLIAEYPVLPVQLLPAKKPSRP